MATLYRKANVTDLESCGPFAYMVEKFTSNHPRLRWDRNFCCFEHPSTPDLSQAVHSSLCDFVADESCLKLDSRTAFEFLKVVNRQKERDLPEGKLASLEPASILLGSNAPADNSCFRKPECITI